MSNNEYRYNLSEDEIKEYKRLIYRYIQIVLKGSEPLSQTDIKLALRSVNVFKWNYHEEFIEVLNDLIEEGKVEVDTAFDTQFYKSREKVRTTKGRFA